MYSLALAASLVLLSGCATLPPPAPPPVAEAIAPVAAPFEVKGRLSVRALGQSFTGNYHWHHGVAMDTLLLTDPLGQGLAEISWTPQGARLISADGREATAENVAALTRQVLGASLPLDDLAYVVQGTTPPGGTLTMTAEGLPQSVAWAGWEGSFVRFSATHPARPLRIDLNKTPVSARLLLDEWLHDE